MTARRWAYDDLIEGTVIESIRNHDPELAQKIMDKMFVFDDVNKLDDKAIQLVLKEVASDALVVALKGAQPELKEKFLANMSSRAAETLREDLESPRIGMLLLQVLQLLLMLDSGRRMLASEGGRSHFDHALNASLVVAYLALRQGDAAGLFATGGERRWVAPQRGMGTVEHLLRAERETVFTWDYAQARTGLHKLYEKAKTGQWNASTDVDWSIEVDVERQAATGPNIWMMQDLTGTPLEKFSEADHLRLSITAQNWLLSQFMHGEQGALVCTAKIVETVPWIDAKYYAATQVMDEARHVEVQRHAVDEVRSRVEVAVVQCEIERVAPVPIVGEALVGAGGPRDRRGHGAGVHTVGGTARMMVEQVDEGHQHPLPGGIG